MENILEILQKEKKQIYKKEEVIKKLNEMLEYKEQKKQLNKINLNYYNCICVIFQRDNSGKAFDVLFLFKFDSENQLL